MKKRTLWWVSKVSKDIGMRKRTFSIGIADLLNHTSMHGYSRLVEPSRGFWEKLMWFIFHVLTFSTLFVILTYAWDEFTTTPLVTILHNPLYPTEKIAFPGVSICSNNRISKKATITYAKRLADMDPERRHISYFLKNVEKFSYLYNFDILELDQSSEFERYLDTHDLNESEMFFNTRERMLELTPKCSDLLLRCSLTGENVPCISKDMFEVKPTRLGYCCVFNVNEMDSLVVSDEKSYRNQFTGPELGLTVVLNASTEDNQYTLFNLNGFIAIPDEPKHIPYTSNNFVCDVVNRLTNMYPVRIHVYDSSKYDDTASGGVSEKFIFQGSESFVSVTPKVINSEMEIRRYHPKTRNCLFKDEYPEKYGDTYSFGNCITRCRVRSIRVLCRCVPFFMPKTQMEFTDDIVHCTLQHVDCLDRYKFKWENVITVRKYVEGLEKEMEDGLYCPECLPPCSDTQYRTSLMTLPMDRFQSNSSTLLYDIQNLSEIALLHVYFGESTAKYYQQIVKNPWFEVFSTIGGICGIVTGFSLGAVCEIIYFFLNEIGYALKEALKRDRRKKRDIKKAQLIICP